MLTNLIQLVALDGGGTYGLQVLNCRQWVMKARNMIALNNKSSMEVIASLNQRKRLLKGEGSLIVILLNH